MPVFLLILASALWAVSFPLVKVLPYTITAIVAPDLASCIAAGASFQSFVIIACLAHFCSVGAYLLMNIWQPRVPATEAGLIYTTEPVFTAIYDLFLPAMLGAFIVGTYANESISAPMLVGGSLVVAANALMQWKQQPRLPPAGPIP